MEESQKFNYEPNKDKKRNVDTASEIFGIIKSMCCSGTKSKSIEMDNISKRILARGFAKEDLDRTIR